MKVCFTPLGWEDYLHWQQHDRALLRRINALIKDICRDPESGDGLGKPERLKGNLSGYLSRRINQEHRLVYAIKDDTLLIVMCRYHYER